MGQITVSTLEAMFLQTCQHRNGLDLEGCLQNKNGEKMNTVFSLLEMAYNFDIRFGTMLLHSDGGVQSFIVTYSFGDYTINIKQFNLSIIMPFDSAKGFADWLNLHEKAIHATATLYVLPSLV